MSTPAIWWAHLLLNCSNLGFPSYHNQAIMNPIRWESEWNQQGWWGHTSSSSVSKSVPRQLSCHCFHELLWWITLDANILHPWFLYQQSWTCCLWGKTKKEKETHTVTFSKISRIEGTATLSWEWLSPVTSFTSTQAIIYIIQVPATVMDWRPVQD